MSLSVKSDSSSIFKKLKDLNTVHRIILTGVCTTQCRGLHSIDPILIDSSQ